MVTTTNDVPYILLRKKKRVKNRFLSPFFSSQLTCRGKLLQTKKIYCNQRSHQTSRSSASKIGPLEKNPGFFAGTPIIAGFWATPPVLRKRGRLAQQQPLLLFSPPHIFPALSPQIQQQQHLVKAARSHLSPGRPHPLLLLCRYPRCSGFPLPTRCFRGVVVITSA